MSYIFTLPPQYGQVTSLVSFLLVSINIVFLNSSFMSNTVDTKSCQFNKIPISLTENTTGSLLFCLCRNYNFGACGALFQYLFFIYPPNFREEAKIFKLCFNSRLGICYFLTENACKPVNQSVEEADYLTEEAI